MSEKNIGDVIKEIKLRKKKKGVYVIFESGEKIALSESSYSDFRLYEGKEVSVSEMEKLLAFVDEDQYYSYALRLLGNSIVKRLKEDGLIDDEEFAAVYANDIADFRLYGKNKTIAKLKEKGIPNEIIAKLSFPDEKEYDRACRYVETLNKKLSKTPSSRKKAKALASLIARGYEREIATEALEATLASTPKNVEEESLKKDFFIAKNKFLKFEDLYIRKQKIFAYLARKGYKYEDIKRVIEEEYNEA